MLSSPYIRTLTVLTRQGAAALRTSVSFEIAWSRATLGKMLRPKRSVIS